MKTSFVAIVVAFLSSGALAMPAQTPANLDKAPHTNNQDQHTEKSGGESGVTGLVGKLGDTLEKVVGGGTGSTSKVEKPDTN
ncbi:hypothetical protein CDD80_7441 [Ophiocordyceps camponoti-rufipedis]|uniref:Secreted protein n=1 Tax=Ophiocordyceps camponoti-rufipedis TaxID=2004952 RepID=A0A2C5YM11_9HYPO|nr:hypothetical protein CDD80_7441 [Ophiocordyceps camponoti-rufipedis]